MAFANMQVSELWPMGLLFFPPTKYMALKFSNFNIAEIYCGLAKCSTKPLSHILTQILTTAKEGLQKYCDAAYARSGVNQMWILKTPKSF